MYTIRNAHIAIIRTLIMRWMRHATVIYMKVYARAVNGSIMLLEKKCGFTKQAKMKMGNKIKKEGKYYCRNVYNKFAPKCPYCGHIDKNFNDDSIYDLEFDDEEMICPQCKKKYETTRWIEFYCRTLKIEDCPWRADDWL
jgi:hypothetical protein